MALHPEFPRSPYEPLLAEHRWFPAAEELRTTAYEKLLAPLVAKLRVEVQNWRAQGYASASPTSVALLRWWFHTEHLIKNADGSLSPFRYYFAQREAVETVIGLHDVRCARDKLDLLRFDASGAVSHGMFPEDWPRYVIKMATGAGKTKVLSLLIAWSFFHRSYEPDSALSRNFLVIAPNIIVLDRLRADFDGLRIFFNDPILPDNGHAGRNWRDDFQLTLHIQDDVRVVRETGNLFLTNIHRVFLRDVPEPSLEDEDLRDYFLAPFGAQPAGKTTDSGADLGEIIRQVDELAVFNDEAHHIHDERLAWFRSIQDIHHRMLQRDKRLLLQIDVTATPRHNHGAIFVQTVSDYPLVEAIHQNVVKHPVLPDAPSRAKLREQKTAIFSEKYRDYLALAIEEWRKSSARLDRGRAEARQERGSPTHRPPLFPSASSVVCSAGQLWKVSKDKDGIVHERKKLTGQWTDWVDYWAVDFQYESRKEIIRVAKTMGVEGALPGVVMAGEELLEFEERWTGSYIFENEWQSFRTRQERKLELTSAAHTYAKRGRYICAVKVIDIFGNDTMTLVPGERRLKRFGRHPTRSWTHEGGPGRAPCKRSGSLHQEIAVTALGRSCTIPVTSHARIHADARGRQRCRSRDSHRKDAAGAG